MMYSELLLLIIKTNILHLSKGNVNYQRQTLCRSYDNFNLPVKRTRHFPNDSYLRKCRLSKRNS